MSSPYPPIITRNDDGMQLVHLGDGEYCTIKGMKAGSVSKTPEPNSKPPAKMFVKGRSHEIFVDTEEKVGCSIRPATFTDIFDHRGSGPVLATRRPVGHTQLVYFVSGWMYDEVRCPWTGNLLELR